MRRNESKGLGVMGVDLRCQLPCVCVPTADMGQLSLQVGLGHVTDSSTVIGQVVVPSLSGLTPTASVDG